MISACKCSILYISLNIYKWRLSKAFNDRSKKSKLIPFIFRHLSQYQRVVIQNFYLSDQRIGSLQNVTNIKPAGQHHYFIQEHLAGNELVDSVLVLGKKAFLSSTSNGLVWRVAIAFVGVFLCDKHTVMGTNKLTLFFSHFTGIRHFPNNIIAMNTYERIFWSL